MKALKEIGMFFPQSRKQLNAVESGNEFSNAVFTNYSDSSLCHIPKGGKAVWKEVRNVINALTVLVAGAGEMLAEIFLMLCNNKHGMKT